MINSPYIKKLKPKILYVFPLAKGVDGILLYEKVVFLIQIKCSLRPNYVEKGLDAILALTNYLQKSQNQHQYTIVPWKIIFVFSQGIIHIHLLLRLHKFLFR